MLHSRRGFTLVEILVALVVLSIIGAGLVRLLTTQTKFTEKQMSSRNARTVSRNAMNIMLTDLRMVQDNGGLIGAASDSVTVRVPVVFGLFCGMSSGNYVLSLLPVDSAQTALGYYGGWAVRDSTSLPSPVYRYADAQNIIPISSLSAATPTICTDTTTGAGIATVSFGGRTGRVVQVSDNPNPSITPTAGWPVFVYQTITYRFEASGAFPGRTGLYRKVLAYSPGGNTMANGKPYEKIDEIIAPFDSTAKFRYYVLNADTAQWAPPASTALGSVRGIQLFLSGSSPRLPDGAKATSAALVTGVFFKNRRDP